jgi:hypothetical protein
MAGTGSDQTIVIASARDGRAIRRLQGMKGEYVTRLAASADGKTLYCTTSKYSAGGGNVWAIPAADGTPRKICAGDGVAVDPSGRDLIVNLIEKTGIRLVRVPISGFGKDIHVQGVMPHRATAFARTERFWSGSSRTPGFQSRDPRPCHRQTHGPA